MKILMISDVYFPRINGVSTSILSFRRALEAGGHEVCLIAPDYGQVTDHETGIHRIAARRVILDPEDRMMQAGAIQRLTERLRAFAPDILHIHTPFVAHYQGVKLARRLGVPAIETYHTFFEEYLYHYVPFAPRAFMRALARRFSRAQCNQVDAVIVPSLAMLDALHGYGVRTPMRVLPTGLNLEKFSGGDGRAFRAAHDVDAAAPVLVFIGRIAFEKNIEFLLKLLYEVKKVHAGVRMILAGEGPAEAALRERVRELDLAGNVLWVGNLHHWQELMDCYCAGDVFVFASRTETQGLVLLEAMALGVPVVSTAIMGTRDILDAHRGALVAHEDLEDFTGKVLELLADPTHRARLGAEGRAYVQEWSAAKMGGRLLTFYGEVHRRKVGSD